MKALKTRIPLALLILAATAVLSAQQRPTQTPPPAQTQKKPATDPDIPLGD